MFKKGDRVVMLPGSPYTYTREGAEGVVIGIDQWELHVRFDNNTLHDFHRDGLTSTFHVATKCAALKGDGTLVNSLVIRKIKQMNKKWDERLSTTVEKKKYL